jgi:intracellular sulfur oxidation DsrE/DsrF family protein
MERRILLGGYAAIVLGLAACPSHAQTAPREHRVAFQVDDGDDELMNEVLNNVNNMYSYYHDRDEKVTIELVAFGRGLKMLRDDISPVKARLSAMQAQHPGLVFSACANSMRAASRSEGKEIKIVPEAGIVPSGVVRLSELQEQGWTYLRP